MSDARAMKVLFLDFDGVLHDVSAGQVEYLDGVMRVTGERLFEHVDLLASLLAETPNMHVGIVIASSWARHFSMPEIKARIGPLATLVIGTTVDAQRLRPCLGRYDECAAVADDLGVTNWLLVDDQVDIVFGPRPATRAEMLCVAFCDPTLGLRTPGMLDRIRRWRDATGSCD